MNTQQKLQELGLAWSVEKRPLICSATGQKTPSFGLFRSDTNAHLGTVGRLYTPYQNSDMVSSIMKASEELGLVVSRGGSLQNGRKVYTQTELSDLYIGGSNTKRYITIVNSHDGTYQVGVGMTNIVVSCQNVFNRMFDGSLSKLRHNQNITVSVDDMVERLMQGIRQESLVLEDMQRMANTKATSSDLQLVVNTIFSPVSEDASPEGKARAEARRDKGIATLKDCIQEDVRIHGESLWGLFNGVTRFYTHHRGGSTEEKRSRFNMNGNGSRVVNKVFNLL
jgi:phage/plasmid-like protein (TIGR03299 family)